MNVTLQIKQLFCQTNEWAKIFSTQAFCTWNLSTGIFFLFIYFFFVEKCGMRLWIMKCGFHTFILAPPMSPLQKNHNRWNLTNTDYPQVELMVIIVVKVQICQLPTPESQNAGHPLFEMILACTAPRQKWVRSRGSAQLGGLWVPLKVPRCIIEPSARFKLSRHLFCYCRPFFWRACLAKCRTVGRSESMVQQLDHPSSPNQPVEVKMCNCLRVGPHIQLTTA